MGEVGTPFEEDWIFRSAPGPSPGERFRRPPGRRSSSRRPTGRAGRCPTRPSTSRPAHHPPSPQRVVPRDAGLPQRVDRATAAYPTRCGGAAEPAGRVRPRAGGEDRPARRRRRRPGGDARGLPAVRRDDDARLRRRRQQRRTPRGRAGGPGPRHLVGQPARAVARVGEGARLARREGNVAPMAGHLVDSTDAQVRGAGAAAGRRCAAADGSTSSSTCRRRGALRGVGSRDRRPRNETGSRRRSPTAEPLWCSYGRPKTRGLRTRKRRVDDRWRSGAVNRTFRDARSTRRARRADALDDFQKRLEHLEAEVQGAVSRHPPGRGH